MSKNEEKSHAILNRWVAMKKDLNSHSKDKRPNTAVDCNNLQECERWRNQIIKELTKKVADIQNASLGEYKIRELNDEINKLLKEKYNWEDRIKELGGPDHKKLAPKIIDSQGFQLQGSSGYTYWGAAKDLPGVRELFAKEVPNAPKKSRADLYKNINFEYYGYMNNEGDLIEEEKEAEKIMMDEYFKEIEENDYEIAKKKQKIEGDQLSIVKTNNEEWTEEDYNRFKRLHSPYNQIHQSIKKDDEIQEKEIEKLLLEKKKMQLVKLFNLEEIESLIKNSNEILKDNKVINTD